MAVRAKEGNSDKILNGRDKVAIGEEPIGRTPGSRAVMAEVGTE